MADETRPRLYLSALHYDWRTPEQACARCRELGLDGIEFSVLPGAGRPHLGPDDYAPVARLAREYGLALSAHVWDDLPTLGYTGAVAKAREWCAAAVQLDCRYLVSHGGTSADRAGGLRLMGEVLAEAAPVVRRTGLRERLGV